MNYGPLLMSQTMTPTPKIYMIDNTGHFVVGNALSGMAPFQVHVSAIPEATPKSCYWDPTAWRADGEHNVCDFDKAALSQKNLTSDAKYFNTDPKKLANPHSVADINPSACFVQPGITLDIATNSLISDISNCVRMADLVDEANNSKNLLGGGSMIKSSYAWDFGDAGSPYNQVKGFNAGHIYSKSGSYRITLTVTNESGLQGVSLMNAVVTNDSRSLIAINSDADVSQIMNVTKGPANGRHIVFKSGTTFHIPSNIRLLDNDWVSSDGSAILTPQTSFTLFAAQASSRTLVENISIQGNTTARAWLASGWGNNQSYRNMVITGMNGAFNVTSSGVLIQNVGNPNSIGLKSNYIIYTIKGLSLYGNHVYFAKEDGDGEPGVRANGSELVSIIDNDLGGYAGKQDLISFRGAKNIYLGSNRIFGGVTNIQWGTSQDPQPAAMPIHLVVENNVLDNNNLQIQAKMEGLYVTKNLFRMRSSTDPFDLLNPYQNPISIAMDAANNSSIRNNAFQFENSAGNALHISSRGTNLELLNNNFYCTLKSPMFLNNELAPFTSISGNTYFLNSNLTVSDISGDWNSHVLVSKNKINDQIKPATSATLIKGELCHL